MPDVNIYYKGESIVSMDASGTKTLQTSGKYCEDNITVQYTKSDSHVLPEVFPPKCVYVAMAKLNNSATGIITATLKDGYQFTQGALKKSTFIQVFRADGAHFGMPVQAAISNDSPGTDSSCTVMTNNSSSNPALGVSHASTFGEIAKFNARSGTDFIVTLFYSDADTYVQGQNPTKIKFEDILSLSASNGTITITEM